MPAPKVRGHYQSLNQISQTFKQQADATGQMLQQLQSKMSVLQGGDWKGDSADKFYQEMESQVVPAIQRLARALEEAARITAAISRVIKQAEDDSAALFKGAGAGGVAVGAAGASQPNAPQPPPDGSGSGASGGSGSSASGADGAGTGSSAGASGAGSGTSAPPPSTPTSGMLTALDPEVAAIAQRSPTLTAQLTQLQQAGWTVVAGTPGAGSVTDRRHHRLVIDPGNPPAQQVGSVAHEGAHALYGQPFYLAPSGTVTRNEYVQINVTAQLQSEGNSQFNEALVRSEVMAAGGPDTGISGTQRAAYERSFIEFQAKRISRDQAIWQMANSVGNDITGTNRQNYRAYYGQTYEQVWDANVAPGRRNP